MKIEGIKLSNFKAFKDVEMKNLPGFCVIVGANGVGKTTLFSVFEFLKTALESNVSTALFKMGGLKGIDEVRSRGATGNIGIQIKFRQNERSPLITYQLEIATENGKAVVEREVLKYRRGQHGRPWEFLNFSRGMGKAVTNESLESVKTEDKLEREEQRLKKPDILAIKGLAQFERFPAVVTLGNLIEGWHISDIKIDQARPEQLLNYATHLSRTGDNLALVLQFLSEQHPATFNGILEQMKNCVPGVSKIEPKITEEGKVLLNFHDAKFDIPFLAKFVSDGTIKMLAYLVLLHDPETFPLLCVEEPENQLYPELLGSLAEQFRAYARRGGQVLVSTHSPDFLNAVRLEEVFLIERTDDGHSSIAPMSDNEIVVGYMKEGDKMGSLWKQGFFGRLP